MLGPFLTSADAHLIALNSADHVLHLLSGALLAGVGAFADKHARTRV